MANNSNLQKTLDVHTDFVRNLSQMRSEAGGFTFGLHILFISVSCWREIVHSPLFAAIKLRGAGKKRRARRKRRPKSKGIFIFILLKTWEMRLTVFLAAPLCRPCPEARAHKPDSTLTSGA